MRQCRHFETSYDLTETVKNTHTHVYNGTNTCSWICTSLRTMIQELHSSYSMNTISITHDQRKSFYLKTLSLEKEMWKDNFLYKGFSLQYNFNPEASTLS